MTIYAVHQFHSGTATGDAITHQMLRLNDDLRRLGFLSNIYAQHIHPDLAGRIAPLETFESRPGSLLLVHHSMGHTSFEQLMTLDVPFVTVFHNITPPEFFDDEVTRSFALLGFEQLHRLAERSLFGVADSNHNRGLMFDAGFEEVEVLPVRSDFGEFRHLSNGGLNGPDWLFVGRVVPNKRQRDLVESFALYRNRFGVGHLHLVGDLTYGPYVEEVRRSIERNDLGSHVSMHGKVSAEALTDRYREAGVFVCLSDHEGFGIPLLEAMAAGLPVIAARSSAVAETLGGGGVLLDPPHAEVVSHVAHLLTTDAELRERVVTTQAQRIGWLERFDVPGMLAKIVGRASGRPRRPRSIQIEGPFETSYSLAIVNRELALMLHQRGEHVTIHATEGPGDYVPHERDLAKHPTAAKLYREGFEIHYPDVTIRNMYPPRVHDSRGGLTFANFAWEETGLPERYVTDFNAHVDGIGATSTFVKNVLRTNGVTVPICVTGNGVDRPDPGARFAGPERSEILGHRFLNISSGFPRKGIDVLLRAYFAAFTADDDVTLVLKTFPNPHNLVDRELATRRALHTRPPRVVWVDRDLDQAQIDGLYALADTYVHPARGEGFGLPVAEAMLAGIPVIATAATGLADLVDESTAAVVSHEMRAARTHLTTKASSWAEPDHDSLVAHLRAAVDPAAAGERARRAKVARDRIEHTYSWSAVAARWCGFIDEVQRDRTGIAVAAISTYNSRCGIAEYSASLYRQMRGVGRVRFLADRHATPVSANAEVGVERVWNHREHGVADLLAAIEAGSADVIHIQYNFGFFTLSDLAELIESASRFAPVVLTTHRTSQLQLPTGGVDRFESIASSLDRCASIIVHQAFDHDALRQAGVTTDIQVIPIGCDPPTRPDRDAARRRNRLPMTPWIVATYGFLLPHKGFITLLEAVAELRRRGIDAYCLGVCALHTDPVSQMFLTEVERCIEELGLEDSVRLETRYLDDTDSKDLLRAADAIVLPYAQTAESSSAAARSVLPLCVPIVTSTARIFDDIRTAVTQVDTPVNAADLADELERIWRDGDARQRSAAALQALCLEYSWADVSRRTRDVYVNAIAARRRSLDEGAL